MDRDGPELTGRLSVTLVCAAGSEISAERGKLLPAVVDQAFLDASAILFFDRVRRRAISELILSRGFRRIIGVEPLATLRQTCWLVRTSLSR